MLICRYNLVIIGAGAGGLVSAAGSAGVGGKVAIIEKHLMGGEQTWLPFSREDARCIIPFTYFAGS